MPDLKLGRLPDRTPVKITFTAGAELNKSLEAYAQFYREAYGQEEPVPQLVPYMLEAFLKSDSAFNKARRGRTDAAARPEPKRARARDTAAATT